MLVAPICGIQLYLGTASFGYLLEVRGPVTALVQQKMKPQ
jgi:hypothetical protein